MSKLVYSWGRVTAGDIISFRYKGKDSDNKLQTVLVFNPKLPNTNKDGTKNFHLIGLKLEDRGVIPTIRSKPLMVQLLERIGEAFVNTVERQIRSRIPAVLRKL